MLSGKAFVPGMGIDSSVGVAGRTKKLRLKTRPAIPELPPVMSAILTSSFPDILLSPGGPIRLEQNPLEQPPRRPVLSWALFPDLSHTIRVPGPQWTQGVPHTGPAA